MDGVNLNPIIDKSTEVIPLEKEAKAAVKIQATVRGFFARQGYLPRKISYKEYSPLVNRVEGMKKADSGATEVYFPHQIEQIILKKSGKNRAITRFHQMQDVRAVLKKQKATHLVIPRAALCGQFLVETRLSIDPSDIYNMWLYTSEPHLFDDAVREFVRLSKEIVFSDLVGTQYHPRNNIVGDSVRYDNLPLYVEEVNGIRTGKFGLIDLEHTSNVSKELAKFKELPIDEQNEILKENESKTVEELFEKRQLNFYGVIARIFPYHLEAIKEEALGLSQEGIEKIDHEAAKGRKFLQEGYLGHSNWLKAKEATVDSIEPPLVLSKEREQAFVSAVKEELLTLNGGKNALYERLGFRRDYSKPGFLKGDVEEVALQLTPLILSRLKKVIEKQQKSLLEKIGEREKNWPDLVKLRSVTFKRDKVYNGLLETDKIAPFINCLYDSVRKETEEQLVHRVIEELVKGGEFYSYDPGYNNYAHEFCWLSF